MLKALISIIILSTTFAPLFAQEDTTISEVSDSKEVLAEEIDDLDEQDEQRTTEKENLLEITLPEYTDNPSYVITFKDPSEEELGVEIELDGKDFTEINSPYTFPALSIGEHEMRFRFIDADDQVQILEHSLTVIPRSPIISSPTIDETSIVMEGSALSNSEILYTLTANAFNKSELITADESGNWTITFSPESGLSDGIYTFFAYTRKYGYASNLSDPVVFAVGEANQQFLNRDEDKREIYFVFSDVTKEDLQNVVTENRDLLILIVGSFLLGSILSLVIKSLVHGSKKERKLKEAEELIQKQKGTQQSSEKTLRELFQGTDLEIKDGKNKKSLKKEVKKKKKDKKKGIVIDRDLFLKDFKHIDPDDERGREKSTKTAKKKIKVSLTSEKESK